MKKIYILSMISIISLFMFGFSNFSNEAPEINTLFSDEALDAYSWLAAQQDSAKLDDGTLSGLVDSFEDFSAPDTPITMAYTYDQAVAAIAFMTYGDFDRAELVLDTLALMQAEDGSWVNSYWYNGYWGAELRKHVGPITWVAVAVRNYEALTGDTVTYHQMAIDAIDYSIQFQQANGGVAGGETTWNSPGGAWINEVWTSTEHNLNLYPTLLYFAETTPSKTTEYETVAEGVLSFLTDVVWDDVNNRFYGGFKNDTGLVDPFVPLDVNPWSVLALGEDYAATLEYIENAAGHPDTGLGTLEYPRYVHTVEYNDTGDTLTGYDFDWQSDGAPGDPAWGGGELGPDVWLEGSAFMAAAYYSLGNDTKADDIMSEIAKKMADAGSMTGGLPYSVKGTNNNYWRMIQQNCISSTGWFLIVSAKWNPYTADTLLIGERTVSPEFSYDSGQYADAISLALTSETVGASIYYTTNGDKPTIDSTLYTSPIIISEDTVVRALAVSSLLLNSSVKEESYLIDEKVKDISINIEEGTYSYDLYIELATLTNEAVIYYTIDGTMPTSSSLVYSEAILVNESITLKALALRDGFTDSALLEANYLILDPMVPPTFSIDAGPFGEMQMVELNSTVEGTVIRYTTNGTTPTSTSPIYSGPLLISKTKTIKAFSSKEGLGNSVVVEATYTITSPTLIADLVEDGSTLTITMPIAAIWADIHISINGGPQGNYRLVNNPVSGLPEFIVNNLSLNDIVRYSFTYDPGGGALDSDWVIYLFGQISGEQLELPVSSLEAGTYEDYIMLELMHENTGAEIYYVYNDNISEVASLYTEPLLIDASQTIFFVARAANMEDSEVVELSFVITIPDEEEGPAELFNETGFLLYVYILSGVAVAGAVGFIIFKKIKV